MKKLHWLIQLLIILPIISNAQVRGYDQCNYGGRSAYYDVGDYNSLSNSLGNAVISCVEVPRGYTLELFTGPNFSGVSSGKITENIACLGTSFNNRVYSLRVRKDGFGGGNGGGNGGGSGGQQGGNGGGQGGNAIVTIYNACNYGGNFRNLSPGNYSTLNNGFGSVIPSSIRVPNGMVIELFSGDKFTGTSTGAITSTNTCLGSWIRGRARSARVYFRKPLPPPPPQPPQPPVGGEGVMFFDHSYFSGRTMFLRAGHYTQGNLGSFNNRITSIKVPRGYSVTVFDADRFYGHGITFTTSVNDLRPYGMSSRISSIIIQRNRF